MKNKKFILGLCGASLLITGALSAQAQVVINEALASNNSYESDLFGGTQDWIELFNTSSEALSLDGMSLSLSLANPKQYTFPPGVSIPAKGYYQIFCDSGSAKTGRNTGFKLSASGGTIYLFAANATATPLDTLDFGPQVTDYSVGRIPDGNGAFALCVPTQEAANQAQTIGTIASVRINEACAGPDDWFEIYNGGSNPVSLGGYYLTSKPKKDPLMFEIPPLSFVGVGDEAFLVYYADEDPTAGKDHVNFKLGKAADDVALMTPSGTTVSVFAYPDMLDNEAYGLVPDGTSQMKKQPGSGTPGASNYLELETVVISEVLTHTDYPDTPPDYIELQNISSGPVDISGWGLSDNSSDFMKYVFPTGTVIQPGAFFVVTEFEFDSEENPNCKVPFRLNSYEGDSSYLTQVVKGARTGYRSQVSFGAAPNNFSFIRKVNADGFVRFPFSEYPTMEATNAPVKIGPVVINEIHYKPAGVTEPTEDEFIEIFNITDQEVPLYYPGKPENPPMIGNAVDYTFPEGMTLAPGAYALVVPFNPNGGTAVSFRTKFNVPEDVVLYGPYSGKLSNDGETVELLIADKPEGDGFIPYYIMDSVSYTSDSPWPPTAKGTGKSLQKNNAFLYGNESTCWGVYAGTDTTLNTTAGRRSSIGVTDQDSDQMPDDWELKYQFDPFNPADAAQDANGDGITNLEHYLNGTNPREVVHKDPATLSVGLTGEKISISFTAQAGAAYEIQSSSDATTGWATWQEVEAGSERLIQLEDTPSTQTRYYRAITK